MNCEDAYAVAALAASGDAAPAELHALETHTAVCAACRAEVAGFKALRGRLRGMREAAAPDSAYAAVRARVVSEIDGRRRRRWILAWSLLAAAAACCIIAVFALHRRAVPVARIQSPVAPVEIASVADGEPRIPAPPVRRTVKRAVRRIATRELAEPIVVHMFTSDPDVVIYWVADAKVKSSKKEIVQ
jgi:anti-sigma factor RsiW